MNEHAEVIANTVYHTFPYSVGFPLGGFGPETPHADDCGGCLINAEVKKLVDKLNELSPMEEIVANLEAANQTVETLSFEISRAFEIAGVPEEGTVTSLVGLLVTQRAHLTSLLEDIKKDLNITISKLRE